MCKVTAHFCDAKSSKLQASLRFEILCPQKLSFVGMITSVGSPLRRRSPQRETVKIVETKTPDLEVPRRC